MQFDENSDGGVIRRKLCGAAPDKLNFGGKSMVEITKDTIIGDILDVAPQTAPIFYSIGMHCLGCPSSRGETVEEACMVHGIDVDKLLKLVNEEANKAVE
jgi:hybrid cluster-associated redox disulfide protein